MHRNQPNIPKIRCIRRTNTQQKGPSHQVRRPLCNNYFIITQPASCQAY